MIFFLQFIKSIENLNKNKFDKFTCPKVII